MTILQIGINGAAGRMGQRLIALGYADRELNIASALEADGHPRLGQDAGEVAGIGKINIPIASELFHKVDVMIDFSSPKALTQILKRCLDLHIPLVYATTGTTPDQDEALHDAAEKIPVLVSPSMSMSVNLAMSLCAHAASILKDKDVDVEILERHHRYKKDSPSGTALRFGKIIAAEMGHTEERHGREGVVGERPHQEIGYHAIRIGDNPGEHTILFGMLGETLEVTVKASNRDCYAIGAITAAKFLHGKTPGLYRMTDVLYRTPS